MMADPTGREAFEKWLSALPWWSKQSGWQRENGLSRSTTGEYTNHLPRQLNEAFQAGRDSMREPWVKVEERLPDEYTSDEATCYLVHTRDGLTFEAQWQKNMQGKFGWYDCYNNPQSGVTHWQPLPAPPLK